MTTKRKHYGYSDWFITFTCYKWINLFEIANAYDLVYKWFSYLREKRIAEVVAYVIIPNHVHLIIHTMSIDTNVNQIVSNGKRFIAYEIIKRLESNGNGDLLTQLAGELTMREIEKGQRHKVFEPSFDAKELFTDEFLYQKLNYIHANPVSGKWNLAASFTDYEHSSASFYEFGEVKYFEPTHFKDVWFED